MNNNNVFSVEVSEENAMLLKSILREECIPYKIRMREYVKNEDGLLEKRFGTISSEREADFMVPYERVIKSEMYHATMRLSNSELHKENYDWDNVRENIGIDRRKLIEELLNDDKTFESLRSCVRETLLEKLSKYSEPVPNKKKKRRIV